MTALDDAAAAAVAANPYLRTYSAQEAAAMLGVGINTVYRLVREGRLRKLEALGLARTIRITHAALEDFLEDKPATQATPPAAA